MSKLTVRVVLTVLISLGAIFAIYTSVQGAAALVSESKAGAHIVGGAMVNLNHDRFNVSELDAYNSQLDSYNDSLKGNGGGGCESEMHENPDL